MRVRQLAPRADDNEEELLSIGRRFGVASPATSLLVLESLDQWLRHDIEPPESLPQMREQWFAAKKNRPAEDPEAKAARHLEMLKEQWKQRMEWWANPPRVGDKSKPQGGHDNSAGDPFRMIAGAVDTDGLADDEDDLMMAEEADEAPVAMAAAPAPAMDTGVVRARRVAGGAVHARQFSMAAGGADAKSAPSAPSTGSISVKAWSPDTPYLKALDAAEDPHAAYLAQRADWASSPAFFLDCAGWFFARGDREFGVRVLSNLAELRIEDPALLRVMAWRLKEAKSYTQSIAILRRVCKLRGEDAQSWRDLALVLDEAGRAEVAEVESHAESAEAAELESGAGRALPGREKLAEALDLYRKVALTPWARHPDAISIFAVEEYNALHAWCTNNSSFVLRPSSLEPLPEGLRGLPDCDMRVVMSWDADETDVDLHVTEPSGEEAYYGHRRTRSGGDVSKDITDGYGPEEYMLRKAPAGGYRIRAHYFASHQQEVFGPATATATIFTDWGRPNQDFQTLSIRLDKAREMIELGTVRIGAGEGKASAAPAASPSLRKGMTLDEVKAILGEGSQGRGNDAKGLEDWVFPRPGGRTLEAAFKDGALYYAAEVLPGGAKTILVQ
jgi:tetratricopeptide (TPR) repeat protein